MTALARRRLWRPDRYLSANLILWVVTYLLISVRMFGDPAMPNLLQMAERRAVVCVAAIGVCFLIQKVLIAARDWPAVRRLWLAAGLSVAGGLFYTLFNWVVFYAIAPLSAFDAKGWEIPFSFAMQFSVLVWSFIAWCAVVFALDYDEQVRDKTVRLLQAQALAAESQNQMLRYQINPHFLFNTLNALSSLILQKDYERAEGVVLSLSRFLRASLEKPPGEKSTLADEIAAQRQYLAIEQVRFGERLRFEEHVPKDLDAALAPSLILQPLVENAVKYGVARSSAPVAIEIAAEARDGQLHVTVRDDARPNLSSEAPQLGVGLENVRRRLAVMYGDAGRLAVGPREGGGFTAEIQLPLERAG